MRTIDLNADLGEGGAHDAALMALASSVNIACGGHAGDEESIRRAVELAMRAQVAIGAHPGYEDPANFGRKAMLLAADEIRNLILRQLERFLQFHPQLHHVKPHGALYHQANADEGMAEALVAAIAEVQPGTILYCPPQGALINAAAAIKMATCGEGFIDRRYLDNGHLCPRTDPRAMIEHVNKAALQALKIASQQVVTTLSGNIILMKAGTLCVHGDSTNAPIILKLSRSLLEDAGIRISAP
jgi:5-oxoprolinase (ATP-hydrolysing) subunit A